MDPITHLTQKILAERARNGLQQQTPPETAPPPYHESDTDSDDEDDEEGPSAPVKLTINAAHSIQGSNNLVPTSPTPLADATKFSTLLLHAVNQINAANAAANAATANGPAAGPPKSRRALKIDLTINCGVTVVGDRNVIGYVGVRPKLPPGMAAAPETAAVAGAKRKAEESLEPSEDEPSPKRVAGAIVEQEE